jgi:hypothetical protein
MSRAINVRSSSSRCLSHAEARRVCSEVTRIDIVLARGQQSHRGAIVMSSRSERGFAAVQIRWRVSVVRRRFVREAGSGRAP